MSSDRRNAEDTSATVATVLVLWAGAVLGGAQAGVFARLGNEEVVALSLFAALFALASYQFDADVRGLLKSHWATLPAALALDTAAALQLALSWPTLGAHETLDDLPHALNLLFVLPLAAVATLASFAQRFGARAVRPAPAK